MRKTFKKLIAIGLLSITVLGGVSIGVNASEVYNPSQPYIQEVISNHKDGWNTLRNGKKIYFKDDKMVTGWVLLGTDWYYLGDDGVMVTGTLCDNKHWYYLYDNGTMAHDVILGGITLDNNGMMVFK
ncbi:hypothetical protein [Clostridium sp. ZBS18]|uniref:hypothetical protein n=1 Tax=Clostridium sp. ZBS18 TaxID=2949967 RepID=UPI002079F9A9|nr:hypothetical protein [Clostridium sp. ZBS18]